MGSLEDAIRGYLAEECLEGENAWRCEKCDRRVSARKKICIWKLPPVLVLHLKRFELDVRATERSGVACFKKITTPLSSGLTVNLTPFVSSEVREEQVYDVVCVSNHMGAFGSGHYTATCRHPVDQKFYYFNDGDVSPLPPGQPVISKDAYVLFLVRHSAQSAQGLRRQTISLPEVWPHWVSHRNSVMLPEVEQARLVGKKG